MRTVIIVGFAFLLLNACGDTEDAATLAITDSGTMDGGAPGPTGGSSGNSAGGAAGLPAGGAAGTAGDSPADAGALLDGGEIPGDGDPILDAALDDAAADADVSDAQVGDVCATLTAGDAGMVDDAGDAGTLLLVTDPPIGQSIIFSLQDNTQHFVVKNVSNQTATFYPLFTVGYSTGLSYSTSHNTCAAGGTLEPGECCGWTTHYNGDALHAADTVSLLVFDTGLPQWPLATN
jgi:hypothetical protein